MIPKIIFIGLIAIASLSIYFEMLYRNKGKYSWQPVRIRVINRNRNRN